VLRGRKLLVGTGASRFGGPPTDLVCARTVTGADAGAVVWHYASFNGAFLPMPNTYKASAGQQ
jgi:hypothetical protein